MQSLTVKAYAKINFFLQVLGKRADGYHEIATLLQNIDLADELLFEEDLNITLECPDNLNNNDNLVLKAAKLLRAAVNTSTGVRITLKKNIPIQAGLGGGSADAAATLFALNKFWNLGLNQEKLFSLGAELGSDVNFFLGGYGGLALAEGRGEQVSIIKAHLELPLVIAKPEFGINAKEAYSLWDLQQTRSSESINDFIDKIRQNRLEPGALFNDLEGPVLLRYPEFKKWYDVGYEAGATAVMLSGSGSAFFAVVPDRGAQDSVFKAWSELKGTVPGIIEIAGHSFEKGVSPNKDKGLSPNELTVFKTKTIDRSYEIKS